MDYSSSKSFPSKPFAASTRERRRKPRGFIESIVAGLNRSSRNTSKKRIGRRSKTLSVSRSPLPDKKFDFEVKATVAAASHAKFQCRMYRERIRQLQEKEIALNEDLERVKRYLIRAEAKIHALRSSEKKEKCISKSETKPDEFLLAISSIWLVSLLAMMTYTDPKAYILVVCLGIACLFSTIVVGYPFRIRRVQVPVTPSALWTHPEETESAKLHSDIKPRPVSHRRLQSLIQNVGDLASDSDSKSTSGGGIPSLVSLDLKLSDGPFSGNDEKDDGRAIGEQVLAVIQDLIRKVLPETNLPSRFLALSDMGLDSLTSGQLCSRLKKEFCVEIQPHELQRFCSIAHLANYITMEKYDLLSPPLPLLPEESPGFSLQRSKWKSCQANRFMVRVGPDYDKNKRKAPAKEPFYIVEGVDLLKSDSRLDHVAAFINLKKSLRGGWLRGLPEYLVVNFQIPLYEPSIWGSADGLGLSLVFYFRLNKKVSESKEAEGPRKLLEKFCSEDESVLRLWKNIVHIRNWEDMNISFVIKEIVRKFSGKPFLTRSRKRIFRGSNYLEIDINQHMSNYVKKATVFGLKDHVSNLTLDFGFLIESQTDEEMPERLIGTATIEKLDYKVAEIVDWNRIRVQN
mmetsp:Transcript_16915/g.25398  ORF Transcript_16915/g.25398 Transcript_16915/m.25398 type:complete len:628 (+) Transcript_16915:87-1970(+)